jgi:cell wall-associated NlpC family hydrolase
MSRAASMVAATVATLSGVGLAHPAHAYVRAAAVQQAKAATAVRIATAQVGDPYRRGATGPRAFDCSGLVQYAWRKAGIRIPRTTWQQFAGIRKRVSWRGLRPGDLVYFYRVGHVGLYIGKGRMVHAPGTGRRVQIVAITPSWWRQQFAGARRPGA